MNTARDYRNEPRAKNFTPAELPPAPSEAVALERADTDTVAKLLEALGRRKFLAAAIFLAVAGLAGVWVAFMPKQYSAEMRLLMTRSRVDAPVSAGERPAEPAAMNDLSEADVNSEIELIKSNDLLEDAARASALLPAHDDSPVETAQIVRALQKNLEVELVKKTNIISVKYLSRNPETAQKLVNTVGDLYLTKHTSLHRNHESSEFFAEKTKEYKAQLEDAQRELASFEQRNGVDLMDAQREQHLRRRAELQAGLNEAASDLRQAQDRAKVLRDQLSALPLTVNSQNHTARNEPLIERLKVMEVELEHKRTELLTKFDPSYRLVQEVEEQLRDTKAALDREVAPGVVDTISELNPVRQTVEAELLKTETLVAGLQAKQRSFVTDLAREVAVEAALARSAPQYDDLKRKTKIAEDNYLLYRRKQEDSQIAEQMDQQRILNVSVLQAASVPALPVERHRSFLLLMALFAGALLSVFSALAVDQMDGPLETPQQAADAAGVPVIANFSRGVLKCS